MLLGIHPALVWGLCRLCAWLFWLCFLSFRVVVLTVLVLVGAVAIASCWRLDASVNISVPPLVLYAECYM